jgi:hypothetical protein
MKDRFAFVLLGVVAVVLAGMCFFARRQEGAVTFATPGVELQVKTRFGHGMIWRSGPEPITVPARTYRATILTVAQEQDGAVWRVSSFGPWGRLGRIPVKAGQTTAVELGPPFRIQPQVQVQAGQVWVNFGLFGQAGEEYQNAIWRNGEPVRGAHVKIVDEAGTVWASGRFQYG